MRSIETKFLVAVGTITIVLFGLVFYRSWRSANDYAVELTASRAELALQFDLAIRRYISDTVRPLMEKHAGKDAFIPEAMSTSFVARRIFDDVQKELPDVILKLPADNPRNPKNAAGPDELKLIEYFRKHKDATKWTGVLQMNGAPYFVQCIPRRMEASCLGCHGRPEDAPASLVARYGSKAGFHRAVGDVIGLDTVGIPMSDVNANAVFETKEQLVLLILGVAVFLAVLAFFFRYFIGNRLAAITGHFYKETAKAEDTHIACIPVTGSDEISILAEGFNFLASRLHSLHNSLEQRVEARTAMLQVEIANRKQIEELLREAKDTAEAANRVKSEFLANMSHELRTPMTAILGFTDILLAEAKSEESKQTCQIIKRNGEHLLTVINDILDLSKIEAGKNDLEVERFSPRHLVADVISTMEVRADAKGLLLAAEFRGDIPQEVAADPVRLRQILINLVGNAIKFTKTGSVRVAVERDTESDEIGRLRFEVTDTGIGIAAEHIPMLFQPFSQVDSSAQRHFGGTGLGLAISKRLAVMLGGDITVSSVLGEGTTFCVTIATQPLNDVQPLACSTNVSGQRQAAKGNAPALDCRVLLAEDGIDNQQLIAFLLRRAGADVTVVDNGQKAVNLAFHPGTSEQAFDVILMDMQMPVLDGYEAAGQLRAMNYRGPIIALTAHAMKEDRQKCLDAGCDDYLAKPIDQKALLRLVATYTTGSPSAESQSSGTSIAGHSV